MTVLNKFHFKHFFFFTFKGSVSCLSPMSHLSMYQISSNSVQWFSGESITSYIGMGYFPNYNIKYNIFMYMLSR